MLITENEEFYPTWERVYFIMLKPKGIRSASRVRVVNKYAALQEQEEVCF